MINFLLISVDSMLFSDYDGKIVIYIYKGESINKLKLTVKDNML
ncbi:hypothetical protein H311_02601 [Anncaliia algerae PRA109]|nr:hypothetical protein H311_02601 [Anncaliia algerae PRA109]